MKEQPKKKKRHYLDLLVVLFGVKRQTIINECCKRNINLANEEEVAIYIKSKKKWQKK